MSTTVKLILSLSLSGSILAMVIFLIKPFIKHKLFKFIQYYIWIVVLLRLIVPFSLETSIMNKLFYGNQALVVANSQDIVQPIVKTGTNISKSNSSLNVKGTVSNVVNNGEVKQKIYFNDLFKQYSLYVWLMGVIITLSVNLTGYTRFLKYLKKSNISATNSEKEMLGTLLNGRRKVKLFRNQFLNTPMLIGIVTPSIIIPDIKFNEKQLKNILLHEIVHLKRFDIPVKWLTMLASSIHWFNPLMYFIKKEINSSCELSCDEAVIKNLSPAEKQDYGDTLISVVAQYKYPSGILQVTMCEEKKGLKERLIAIMNHTRKSKKVIILSAILLLGVIFGGLYLGAGIGTGKAIPPAIYINAEEQKTKVALMGTYLWQYNGKSIEANSEDPNVFKYKLENIVSVIARQQFIIGTQKLNKDKKYDFSIEKISIYKDGKPIELFKPVSPSFMNGNLYMMAPQDAGEYVYTLRLNFKDRGTVSYGFVIRVDMPNYDLTEISKYKTPYIGDNSKVSAIVGNLPVPDNYFNQQYTSLVTEKKPYKLNVFYEAKKNASHISEWPVANDDNNATYSNMSTNALVLFCMIDNLDEVTFAYRDSQSEGKLDDAKYNYTYSFTRDSFEKKYGDLSVMGEKLELLKSALQ
ncbi:DUF4825 domain-containing protein [Clostridium bowmanii]|uniref:M56 family metallopeptidase n=1 Tax=Clostridium bowmanii TaxID=132925 RepID=UPI001C0AC57D|nr:M56 family metallopeptidase [Clostridium bowmanii]MBU3192276.1 DUF4825 domain-containing protein [Clostridium bowmanii]MCA1076503.1 DUF4825 domain-containing protein [Clostridium bowmanii]